MKNIKIRFIAIMMLSVLVVFACTKDDEVKVPKVSFESSSYTISETTTSVLEVIVKLNTKSSKDLNINFNVAGTAVAGVNYESFTSTSVSIEAGKTEAIVFVNVMNEPTIEGDKTLELNLAAGSDYELASENTTTIVTIQDNEVAPSDAPVVQFTSGNVTVNAYLQDTLEVKIGIDKAFSENILIPLTIAGTAESGTDYELLDLNENNEIEMIAGELTGIFRIAVKYNAVENLNVSIDVSLAAPIVTDYAVADENNSVQINIIDPVADYSAWFNESTKFNYFYAGGSSLAYRDDLLAYNIYKRYYWDPITEGGSYKILSGEHHFAPSQNNYNAWVEVVNVFQKLVGWPSVDVVEQERWEINPGGSGDLFGLTDFFPNLAEYSKTLIRTEKDWLRFVAFDAEATEGKVIIPSQTLTLYKVKSGFNWDESFVASDGVETYRAWYADSRSTQGQIDQSTNVETASVQIVGGEGTYSNITGEIVFDITFSCSDPDFSIDPSYYIANEGNTYTMRIKYIKQ